MPNTYHLDSLIAPGDPAVRAMTSYHTTNDRHDHDFYELVYVTEGFCLHDSGGRVTLLMEGDIFILKPWVSHKYIGNRVTFIYNCIFGAEAVSDEMDQLSRLPGLDRLFSADPDDSPPRLHLALNERKDILRIIQWMHEECEAKPIGWQMRVTNLLGCLLISYARAYQAHIGGGEEKGAYSAYVGQALSCIDRRYQDSDLTIGSIADSVGVTGDYLSRQFRQVMGIPAQEYLRRYRFARAMELLQSDIAIGDVAVRVGFSSLSHFSREFRREMGMTPSQYRFQNRDSKLTTRHN